VTGLKNNKTLKITLALLMALFIFFVYTGTALAVMLKISEEELIKSADLIVTGTVTDIQGRWNADRDIVYSEVTVYVEETAGDSSYNHTELMLIVRGGEVGDVGQINSLAPVFYPGQEVLLYLQVFGEEHADELKINLASYSGPLYSLYGHFQGKREVIDDKINEIALTEYLERVEDVLDGAGGNLSPGLEDVAEYDQIVTSQSNFDLYGQKWPASSIPVKYRVNATGGPAGSLTAIQNAAEAWNGAGANFSFSYDGEYSRLGGIMFNGVNEILFFNSGGPELARAEWQYNRSTGFIMEADFYFNTRFTWTTAGVPLNGAPFDVQTVAMHELGHWLSLGHSEFINAVMYTPYQGVRRNLHPDDIAGIKTLYGASLTEMTLTVASTNPAEGVVIAGSSGHGGTTAYSRTIEQNSTVTLTAPEYHGSGASRKRFDGWSGAISSAERTVTFIITTDMLITANYADDQVLNNNADLSALGVGPGTLNPLFEAGVTSYVVEVPEDTATLLVTAATSDNNAAITINGTLSANGEAKSVSLGAAGTATPVLVSVTAADGITVKSYSINVIRAGSTNPFPLFLYYENDAIEIVRVDYQRVLDDLFDGDARLLNDLRMKIFEAFMGPRAIYVQDTLRTIDYLKAANDGKTYLEAYNNQTYSTTAPVPLKELILNQGTGIVEEVLIN
jgi:hypothetical protein